MKVKRGVGAALLSNTFSVASCSNKTSRFATLALSCAGVMTACQASGTHYDAEASRAFRAAWDKRRAGDEAGYRAGLAEVAKKKGTFAGDRAALDLEMIDEPANMGA